MQELPAWDVMNVDIVLDDSSLSPRGDNHNESEAEAVNGRL